MVLSVFIDLMERGLIPESVVRLGIRKLCKERLESLRISDPEKEQERDFSYIQSLKQSTIAFATDEANRQHYELPASFYHMVLGKNKKYSSGFWPEGCQSLDSSEDFALDITLQRAEVQDGMKILDLGCGWGSVTLKLAERFPRAQVVGLSNSRSQRAYILQEAMNRGLSNIEVVTGDIGVFTGKEDWAGSFDRIISVEMLEHVRNYEALFERLSGWLKTDGKLFAHIFAHRLYAYPFETEGDDNWMGRHFFTGGQMPSRHLLSYFQKDLLLEKQWVWSGLHYQKTSDAWLRNMESRREEILRIFSEVYGQKDATRWFERWKVFFMSCSELFGYQRGQEWGVSHYLFQKRRV